MHSNYHEFKFVDELFREDVEGTPNPAAIRWTTNLAKMGIESPGLNGAIRKDETLKDRNNMRRACKIAGEKLDELVNSKEPWSDKKQKEYESMMEVVSGARVAINHLESRLAVVDVAQRFANPSAPASMRNAKGETIRVLTKQDTFANNTIRFDEHFGFGEYVKSMVAGTNRQDIRNALTEGTDSAGGYTVPAHLMSQLIDAMRANTVAVQAGALTIPLETEKTTIARLDSDPQAGWRLELGAVAESSPTFGAVTFTARSLACLVKVSRELLEDSINIDSAIMTAFASAMAGELDRVALFGSGTAPEPRGLFNTNGVSAVSMGDNGAALSNYSKMLDAIYEMEISNASAATAWVMSPRTSRVLNGLTDTTGQPLNAPKAVSDIPRLVSSTVPINQEHGTANNASPIILGDFSQLLIGVRTQLRIEVMRELFAGTMEYAFLAHLRADIAVAQPKSFSIVKGIIP